MAQSVQRLAMGWTTGLRFPAESRDFSLRHRLQPGSGVHPASYPMDTGVSFLGDKQSRGETDHSLKLARMLRMRGSITPLPNTSSGCDTRLGPGTNLPLSCMKTCPTVSKIISVTNHQAIKPQNGPKDKDARTLSI
jgi:hypothetical protein